MRTEEQRIVIAKSCGWEDVLDTQTGYIKGDQNLFDQLTKLGCCPVWSAERQGLICSSIPDYLSDLNAMHEAEKVFNDCEIKWSDYRACLHATLEPHRHELHATASQRAEAFLKTLGKWKDS